MKKKINVKTEKIVFLLFIIIVIGYRLWLLNEFGFKFTDSDQSIMWLGTKDYAHGFFHEPLFYGQNYNSMLESLLAVPLYKIGIPLYIALPTITTLLTLFPYFVLSISTYLKSSKIAGILILTIPILLPIEYDFITSLSRGFVTGLAIVSITFFPFFWKKSNLSFVLFVFLNIFGVILNPNAILLTLPCAFYLFLQNFRNIYFYIYSIVGLILGILIYLSINSFYQNHPNYILHTYELKISIDYFFDGISHLDSFFNNVSLLFWKKGWIMLFIPFIFSFFLFKLKKNNEAIVALSIPFLLLIPLITSKIHDGTNSVFFPLTRMYLAIPLLLAFLVSFLQSNKEKLVYIFLSISFVFLIVKISNINPSIDRNLNKNHVVAVIETEKLLQECQQVSEISNQNKIDLIIINDHWFYDFYNYGCSACIGNFPNTIRPAYERRTWRLSEDENIIYSNVLIIDLKRALNDEYDFVSKIEKKQGFYVYKNNKLPTALLLKKLKINVREYK